jgi:hypothetical protein
MDWMSNMFPLVITPAAPRTMLVMSSSLNGPESEPVCVVVSVSESHSLSLAVESMPPLSHVWGGVT